MHRNLPILFMLLASPALAESTRGLDAHEHGVGALDIAFEDKTVVLEFRAPGADIVGFEHDASTGADRAAINAAVATLSKPLDLFLFPADAGCSVTKASAELHGDHDDHDHEAHAHEHNHDHGHADKHDTHAQDDHTHEDHKDHAEAASHSEFHASYSLTCETPEQISSITFAYFDVFENARELEVQMVSSAGAQAFEVTRSDPVLDLRGMF
ncbi:hypothetical protein So717_25770 [Roseobacter cerasinus]|uniref:DUF2796 domain-containing protein n=1 Tax=Roseobacter cerasinus TaxID=2602289 RepID=A0A640VTA1_9RHOB|nr:DUF2796 domain-containing protein [Roseobacter cerasinus]GFE50824.1 hypothetical protein So717_25770 [Roseobacter cerasinus]